MVTDAADMATALRKHWGPVFSKRRCDREKLHQWMQEDLPKQQGATTVEGLPPATDPRWAPRRADIRKAVANSPNSMPGPDGIPFMAWRQLGELSTTVLFEALKDIAAEGGQDRLTRHYGEAERPEQAFNASLMILLPKGVSGQDPVLGGYCVPADTRPINITNCDNRLLANAARIRAEPLLEAWVSPMQRGFLPGRSMIANVIDVDHEMMRVALQEEAGMAIFFDFQAAFPSVLHEYLQEVLQHMGLPGWLLNFVGALYSNNHCQLVVGGGRHEGFDMKAGIRQGCPLSPLIFAVTADPLLRRMARRLSKRWPASSASSRPSRG